MDFQARIDEELKVAMKAREAERLSVLRMLKSALKNAAIEKGGAEARSMMSRRSRWCARR